MAHNLPRRTPAQKTGCIAVDSVVSVLDTFANVIPCPQERDFGIDLHCELFTEDGYPTGRMFYVQCKGTDELEATFGKATVAVKVKTRTTNYWRLISGPVFLIVVDLGARVAYWHLPSDGELQKDERSKTKTLHVQLSTCFPLDSKLPAALLAAVVAAAQRARGLGGGVAALERDTETALASEDRFAQLGGIRAAMEDMRLATDAINRIAPAVHARLLTVARAAREECRRLVQQLEYTKDSAKLGDILEFEFSAGTCNEVWAEVDTALERFAAAASWDNSVLLTAGAARLLQLNRDIEWCTRMLGEGAL